MPICKSFFLKIPKNDTALMQARALLNAKPAPKVISAQARNSFSIPDGLLLLSFLGFFSLFRIPCFFGFFPARRLLFFLQDLYHAVIFFGHRLSVINLSPMPYALRLIIAEFHFFLNRFHLYFTILCMILKNQ